MSAELRTQTNVIQTPCAPTRKAHISVAVLKGLRVMDRHVQVSILHHETCIIILCKYSCMTQFCANILNFDHYHNSSFRKKKTALTFFLLFADVDECTRPELNECDLNAMCTNTEGSYVCRCKKNFEGDGRNCTGTIFNV